MYKFTKGGTLDVALNPGGGVVGSKTSTAVEARAALRALTRVAAVLDGIAGPDATTTALAAKAILYASAALTEAGGVEPL